MQMQKRNDLDWTNINDFLLSSNEIDKFIVFIIINELVNQSTLHTDSESSI